LTFPRMVPRSEGPTLGSARVPPLRAYQRVAPVASPTSRSVLLPAGPAGPGATRDAACAWRNAFFVQN
jgi:hypothetical protein